MITTTIEMEQRTRIGDKAAALQVYYKQSGESLGIQNAAAEVKIRAERRAGEILAAMEKRGGARDGKTELPKGTPLLSDIGITKKQSHRWQQVASVPDKKFEAHVAR
jgi:hypothetical protein